ncbi:MAG: hypothetical protein ACLFRA_06470 [Alphaproteobacteria bacterium]
MAYSKEKQYAKGEAKAMALDFNRAVGQRMEARKRFLDRPESLEEFLAAKDLLEGPKREVPRSERTIIEEYSDFLIIYDA